MDNTQLYENLVRSEAKYRSLVENSIVGVFISTLDGRFTFVNDAMALMFEFGSTEQMIAKGSLERWSDPEDRVRMLAELQEHGSVPTFEAETVTHTGRHIHVLISAKQIDDNIYGMMMDISKRKQAEEALLEALNFMKHLTSSVPDTIISIKLPERTVNWANDSFNVLGYQPEEYTGKSTEKYYANPEDYQAVGDLQRDAIREGKDFIRTEVMARRKDGRVIPVELTATFYKEKGKLAQITALVRDITDRKQAEEALRKNHDFLKHLTSSVPDAVFSIKMPDRTIEWANDSFHVLGYEPEECIGKLTSEFYANPEEFQAFSALLTESIQEGKDVLRAEALLRRKSGEVFPAEVNVSVYREYGEVVSTTALVRDVTERKLTESKIRDAFTEIELLKVQLQAESSYLQEEIKLEHNFENIIGQSEALKYVLHKVEMVAPKDTTVILLGETGTGKELIARALHRLSSHSKRPLVKVNCAALPSELIESELFGREKGAFTGATATQVGRFELAHGSTLFLDEVGELPLELQAKLLRVLESGEFEKLGSSRTLHSNARIIAATNRDLEAEVRENRFREDLWYRLKVFPITVPPLRDRIEDIPLLVDDFLQFFSRKMGISTESLKISKLSMRALQSHSWPGNVRELRHAVESALISVEGNQLLFDLPKTADAATSKLKSFEEMEREYILEVLKAKNWKIGGEDSASSVLGLPPSTLRSRIKKLGLKRP